MRKISHPLFFLMLLSIGLVSCKDYGEKVSKDFVEVYYKNNITKEQAQQTLELLYPSWNDAGNKKSVQLTKNNDTIHFRMVINEEKAKDVKDEAYFLLANGISAAIFKDAPVNVDLTDDTFKPIRTLHFKKMETADENYGTKISAGNIDVYRINGVTEEECEHLAQFLDQADGTEDRKSFQAGKKGDEYVVKMVSSPERSAAIPENEFFELAGLLSDSIFNGAAVSLQLTDHTFQPFQSFRTRK